MVMASVPCNCMGGRSSRDDDGIIARHRGRRLVGRRRAGRCTEVPAGIELLVSEPGAGCAGEAPVHTLVIIIY